jgi:hypothetical protein
MAFNKLDSFSQILRERSYDDLEKQKLGKAISHRDKWNLKMDISSLKKELTDLQNTAAQLPDDYVEEICRSENYPLEDSIDNDMELNQWCDETEDLLDDSLGLNESLFGGSPEKRLLRQMQRLQKKIDSCDDLAEKLELNKQILELANKRSSLFYNSMNMPLTEDYKYKAKIGDSYLKGNGFTTKASEADTFESETEPRQRINQMRKDGKHIPKGNVSVEKIKESRMKYSRADHVNQSDIFNIVGECLEDYNFQKTTAKEPVPMTYRIQKVQDFDELSASVDGNYYDDIIVECNFTSHFGYSYIIITQDSGEQATWAGYTKSELKDDIVEAIKICLKTSKEHAGKKTFENYLDEIYDGDRESVRDFIDSISNIFKGDEFGDLMTKYMTKEEFSKTYSDLLNN